MSKPISYLQTDAKWKNADYSAPGEKTTIGASGCGPTAAAMVVASWVDKKETPVEACAWALQKGYKAVKNGTYHSFFKPYGAAHGLTITQITGGSVQSMSAANAAAMHEKALAAIKNGDLVICLMGKGNWTSSGHYILWYDYDGANVYINDPASTKATRLKNKLTLLQAQVKHYWICSRPSGGALFNDYARGAAVADNPAPAPSTPASSTKLDAARSFDKALAGTYKVTASALNIRAGAGTNKALLGILKRGSSARCYGYYTTVGSVKWLYVVASGITGFVSSQYLSKV